MTTIFPRISGRRGQVIDLNIEFRRNGVLTNPYAIRKVEIYQTAVATHNLLATISVLDPDDPSYPAPISQGTDEGKFNLYYEVPTDFVVPNVFFDVWYYFADNPFVDATGTGTEPTDEVLDQFDDQLLKCCHRFWVYPDEWFCNDGLQTVRFGFEPLDQKFNSPEVRNLEVGLMPLPLYQYNYDLVQPLIPFLTPTISIETQFCELLVDAAPMTVGLRQGYFRDNPFVLVYQLDTSLFLKGTYRYQVTLALPDGSSRVSQKYIFTIS